MRDCVLVGGGHAHVQVLRAWARRPPAGIRLTVVVDRPFAIYSGMVPGWVAGDYTSSELEIDVISLARSAGARVVLAAARNVDPDARTIDLEGASLLHYDVASLDVGSTVRGLELPGVAEHALTTRPIGSFVSRLEERLRSPLMRPGAYRVAIIGGGVAGAELAFTLDARLRREGRRFEITLLSDPELLPEAPALARPVRQLAGQRGIRLIEPFRATYVDAAGAGAVDRHVPADLVLVATGAAPHAWQRDSLLPLSDAGFIRVGPTLQVASHETLFAVGDCAAFDHAPWVPKAGVYAVRMGPVLEENLRRHVAGRPLTRYRPQRDFLALLNVGGQRAIGAKWGVHVEGHWVWRLKDWIDRRFMRRFEIAELLEESCV